MNLSSPTTPMSVTPSQSHSQQQDYGVHQLQTSPGSVNGGLAMTPLAYQQQQSSGAEGKTMLLMTSSPAGQYGRQQQQQLVNMHPQRGGVMHQSHLGIQHQQISTPTSTTMSSRPVGVVGVASSTLMSPKLSSSASNPGKQQFPPLYTSICTVKASNLAPHGNFGPILARSLASSEQNMNRTKFGNRRFFLQLYFLHFSVGRVLMVTSPSEKKRFKVSMKSKVRGFEGDSDIRLCVFLSIL
jgi:hypothetical protein